MQQAQLTIHALDAGAEALLCEQAERAAALRVAPATWLTALGCECPAWHLPAAGGGHVLIGTQADEALKARLWVLSEQLRLDEPECARLALVPAAAVEWLTAHDADVIVPFPDEARATTLGKLITAWQGLPVG